jgi:peroxiredoxin
MKTTINTLLFSLIIYFVTLTGIFAQSGYGIGDKITNFTLKSVSGNMVSLSDYKDAKGFIIIFSCNHCPWVVLYEDRIIELHNTFASKGYQVVAINSNDSLVAPEDSYSKMIVRANEKGFPFEYLYDETQDVARQFGATRTPQVYIVNKKGMTVEYIGTIDNNPRVAEDATEHYVKNAIEELLSKKSITVKETKAIGCTIKWRKTE